MNGHLVNGKARIAQVAAVLAAITGLTVLPATGAQAQPPRHRHTFFQRHRNAAGIGVGLAVHHHLKRAAARDRALGRRPSFAERHPILSGTAAGLGTRHILKHHH